MTTPDVSVRSSGVLLHPTSLPGRFGIGDMGPSAYAWVDALVQAEQSWWQVLPLGPTGYGDSPYQCFSAFAGNPYLISPEELAREGLMPADDLQGIDFPADQVSYGSVIPFKNQLLAHAWQNFRGGCASDLRDPFDRFCAEQASWLDDYALYMSLKESQPGTNWQNWSRGLVLREAQALSEARTRLADTIRQQQFRQFLFFRQWRNLKEYANSKGLKLIGDIPIFVAIDSVDVWANPDLFLLGPDRHPQVVAGVPPDYFSVTGQLWGNPHYNWEALKKTGYAWWMERLRATLAQVDLIRLDHFLGFSAAWHVPAGRTTAEIGEWVPGPGANLFETIRTTFGSLPIIAEDLGLVTPAVEALRDQFQLPGMRILHFAFGDGPQNRFLPHNYEPNTLVYTGTHDNNTSVGWYQTTSENEKDHVRRYLGRDGSDIAWDLIRLAWSSVANYAVTPLQDLLSLGSDSRMNMPGRPEGNWSWRFRSEVITDPLLDRLGELTALYGR